VPERPQAPFGPLVTWIAIVADVAALVILMRSGQPLWLKLSITGVDVLGVFAIVGFFLGRRREWVLLAPRIKELERELNRLRQATGSPPASVQREAA
jgi:hypothetical protein